MNDEKSKAKPEGEKPEERKPTPETEPRDGYSHRSMTPAHKGDSKGKHHGASEWESRRR